MTHFVQFSFTNILNLLKLYDAFILDIWGVIHDGIHAYPGVIDCVNSLISSSTNTNTANAKKIIFLSNAPRPNTVVLKGLTDLGLKVTADMVITSGDLVRFQLQHFDDPIFSKLGKRFYHLGEERNQDILSDLNVQTTKSLKDANFILVTGFLDSGENLSQHDELLKEAIRLHLPMICANPDVVVVHNHSTRYCAGFIAEKYEQMGGKVHYYGKPYPSIYELALKRFLQMGIQNKEKILAVGDTLETDILGAYQAGIASALVLTGNMGVRLQQKDKHISEAQFLQSLFNEPSLTPTWVMNSLSVPLEALKTEEKEAVQ